MMAKIFFPLKNENHPDHEEFICRIAKTLYYGNTSPIDRVSFPLTELAVELYSEVKKDCSLEQLEVDEAAEIALNACVSTCSLVLAILYLEKMKSHNPEYINKVAPSELFLVSLLVASKFLNDEGDEDSILNSEWAKSARLPLRKINSIEKEFLNALRWEVYVSENEFWKRLTSMEKLLAFRQGKQRGWLTYTEVNTLLSFGHIIHFRQFLMMSAVCLTSYTIGVLSMFGMAAFTCQISDHVATQMGTYSSNMPISDLVLSDVANSTAINSFEEDEIDLNTIYMNMLPSVNNDSETFVDKFFTELAERWKQFYNTLHIIRTTDSSVKNLIVYAKIF